MALTALQKINQMENGYQKLSEIELLIISYHESIEQYSYIIKLIDSDVFKPKSKEKRDLYTFLGIKNTVSLASLRSHLYNESKRFTIQMGYLFDYRRRVLFNIEEMEKRCQFI